MFLSSDVRLDETIARVKANIRGHAWDRVCTLLREIHTTGLANAARAASNAERLSEVPHTERRYCLEDLELCVAAVARRDFARLADLLDLAIGGSR